MVFQASATVDSIPEFVMRTGVISPFNPTSVRQDVQASHIDRITNVPIDRPSGPPSAAASGTNGFGDYLGMPLVKEDIKYFALAAAGGGALAAGIGAAASKRGNRGRGALYGAISGVTASLLALAVNRLVRP